MPNGLCRLTVQYNAERGPHEVDLALPSGARVGELLPAIVDIVYGDGFVSVTGCRWRLSQIGGHPVDETMSFADNEIHDGAVVVLTATEPPPPRRMVGDSSHVLAAAAFQRTAPGPVAVTGCLMLCGVAAASIGWPRVGAGAEAFVGAGLAAAAAAAAVLAGRHNADRVLTVTLSVVAALFTAAAGFRAVPAGSLSAHALLACAAAGTVAMVMLRVTDRGTVVLTSIATLCMLSASVVAAAAMWPLAAATVGALLATLALAALSVAPRITIALTGIGPALPSVDGVDAPAMDEGGAATAHRVLSGLVLGASGAACVGSVLVVVGGLLERSASPSAPIFTAIVGLVLLLRARTHAHAIRRIGVVGCGIVSVTACFVVAAVARPELASWIALAAAATGVAALAPLLSLEISPATRRAVEVAEYAAVSAVIPLACWVGGVYGLVRGLSLP